MSTFQLKIYFILTSLLDQVLKTDVTTLLKVINKDTVYCSVSLTFWISMGNFASFKNVSLLISLFCPRLIRAVYFLMSIKFWKIMAQKHALCTISHKSSKNRFLFSQKLVAVCKKGVFLAKKSSREFDDFLSKTYLYRECTSHCYCTKAAKLFSGTASVILLCIFSVTWVHRGW